MQQRTFFSQAAHQDDEEEEEGREEREEREERAGDTDSREGGNPQRDLCPNKRQGAAGLKGGTKRCGDSCSPSWAAEIQMLREQVTEMRRVLESQREASARIAQGGEC